ncbi:MAG: 4-alpha-glucanotransferase [Psychromonas sp.]|nr:4-alpha-glucanotransferase [Psychromonas sp.]
MTRPILSSFAQMKGIDPHFVDARGNPAIVSDEHVRKLIKKMGYDSQNETLLEQCIEDEKKQHWLSFLPAVAIFKKTSDYIFDVCLPINLADKKLVYKVTTEEKKTVTLHLKATDFDLSSTTEISKIKYQCSRIKFESKLPLGYHQLDLLEQGKRKPLATMSLIIAPQGCYCPQKILDGEKIWGASIQFYCIKSELNWGIGDFSDLKVLLKYIKDNGGDFIGLNPIHALTPSQPQNPSPYSPSSRKWLNILYIDITAVDELSRSKDLQTKIKSTQFRKMLNDLRDNKWVDYKAVTALKLSALRSLFTTLNNKTAHSSRRYAQFEAYIASKDDSLIQQASFDALQFKFLAENEDLWGWPVWPTPFKSYQSQGTQNWIKKNQDEVRFWCYCQWVTELQLEDADNFAKSLGMTLGIYRDLAVGVGKNSAEIWANQDLYSSEVSIGAPPDILGPLGQSWGLPPIAPDKLVKARYQPFIDLLQSNMKYCGALRIDHVMALLRLWWVPEGETADAGAYIYYAVEDMLNILALESMRNQCLVIGEDLGTVPDGMDVLLKDAGIYSYKVFFFEAKDGKQTSPHDYNPQAMATLATHDMPTIKGFWQCDDLYLGKELGLYVDQNTLDGLLNERLYNKQSVLNSLHEHQSLPSNYTRDALYTGINQVLNFSMQKHLAKGSCALLSLQLEDFLEMDSPVNVPGTSNEYRNWQRKLSCNLKEIFTNKDIKKLLEDLTNIRCN